MPITYSEFGDKDAWVYQPQLTRWRFAHRAPISSLRWNQEQNQFNYDILRLRKQTDILTEALAVYFGELLETPDIQVHWEADNVTEVVELISEEEIGARLAGLINRLEAIEKDL